jgi:hyperosmotically inducible periplasmic protein
MVMAMRFSIFTSAVVLALIVGTPVLTNPRAMADPAGQKTSRQPDSQLLADIKASLNPDRFKDIHVSVKSGVVDLSGTVELYAYKEEAGKRAQRNQNVAAVRNEIRVAGPEVSDAELQNKLVEKVQYDRVGYGTTAFNAISVSVRNGVVTLGGHAYGPTDKDSAISLATHMRGVQDVIDEVQVDPVSPMDDRIRIQVARSVYGHPALNKYAIDPGKPIRISVQNGHVTLFGVVDNQMDKDVANIQANGVPGIFSVTNQLEVGSPTPQRD